MQIYIKILVAPIVKLKNMILHRKIYQANTLIKEADSKDIRMKISNQTMVTIIQARVPSSSM